MKKVAKNLLSMIQQGRINQINPEKLKPHNELNKASVILGMMDRSSHHHELQKQIDTQAVQKELYSILSFRTNLNNSICGIHQERNLNNLT